MRLSAVKFSVERNFFRMSLARRKKFVERERASLGHPVYITYR